METLENRLQKRIHISLYALIFLTFLLGLSVLLEGCSDKCEVTNTFYYYEPVYTPMAEIRAGIELKTPEPIRNVGKIYFKEGYLFVNEPNEGIHIIDNRNPAQPVVKSFLHIPGNFELAINGNTLYADSYVDLVALDISDLANITEVSRLENIFTGYNSLGFYPDPVKGVITDWVQAANAERSIQPCEENMMTWGGYYYMGGVAFEGDFLSSTSNVSAAIAPGNGSGPGVGGSMARFTLSKNHLYVLDPGSIQPFDVANEKTPVAKAKVGLSWNTETIFPHNDNLFIGSTSGMLILDITDPDVPSLLSTYTHITSCDPVVVDDEHAFVTLRSGTTCQGFTNQLEVIDITNLASPQLTNTYEMVNPHGLGKDGNTLFVCDGTAGLKVYDAAQVNIIDQKMLAHFSSIQATDVIPLNDVLMMMGADGIYQYDYSDIHDIKLLSVIPIAHGE